MKRSIQKSLCILLAVIMLLSIVPVSSVSAAPAGDRLDGWNESVYEFLKTNISAVASGTQASTVFTISDTADSLKWSRAELGVSAIIANGAFTDAAISALGEKFAEAVDLDAIMHSLLADFPYDLYWYDKVSGVQMSYRISGDSSELRITELNFKLSVCDEYSAGQYTVDTNLTQAMSAVTERAQAIVEKHAGKSDWDKLTAYKNEICDLVAYNHTAADDPSTPYGNPWQLIYVFDNDATTNVVCEGYAKAFKFLCDLTDFQDDVYCYTVTGYMQGATGAGDHMWNVVEISGGRLMVDVTNCDEGSIGAPDQLFLTAGTKQDDAYAFSAGGSTIYYTYDPDEYDLYVDGYLELYPIPESADPDYLTYEIDDNGAIITRCDTSVEGTLIIPSVLGGYPVASIRFSAFSGCEGLTEVILPETLKYIGNSAFYGCTGLTEITIPASVTEIGSNAFGSCTSLKAFSVASGNTCYSSVDGALYNADQTELISVLFVDDDTFTVPSTVTYIADGAFSSCIDLFKVNIGANASYISPYAFEQCNNLHSIWVDHNNPTYSNDENGILYDKDKTAIVYVPMGVTGQVTLPTTLLAIEEQAFAHRQKLTSVTVLHGTTSIANAAFFNCTNLMDVTLGAGVTDLHWNAFELCTSLQGIWVNAYNPNFSSYQGVLFNKNQTVLMTAPKNLAGSYTIPAGVLTVADNAFNGCEQLTEISGGKDVTTIGNAAFKNCIRLKNIFLGDSSIQTIGEKAFFNCYTLEKLSVPVSLSKISDGAFDRCSSLRDVYYGATLTQWEAIDIGGNNDAFNTVTIHTEEAPEYLVYEIVDGQAIITDCSEDVSDVIRVPSRLGGYPVTAIADYAFANCMYVYEIYIPEGVTSIGNHAFDYSWRLDMISLPSTLTSIGADVAKNCSFLNTIYFAGTQEQWNAISIAESNEEFKAANVKFTSDPWWYLTFEVNDDEVIVTDCDEYYEGEIVIPLSMYGLPITTIGDHAFENCEYITGITLGENVNTIGEYAFSFCRALEYVNVESIILEIREGAFFDCQSLKSFELSEYITTIADYAFAYCNNLESIEIPNGVTSIGDSAFSMTKFTEVTIPNSVTSIGNYAFHCCADLQTVTLSNKLETIGEKAFNECVSLTSITIPSSVTAICTEAFNCCSSLSALYIEDATTYIGTNAFAGCATLGYIYFGNNVTAIEDGAFGLCTSLTQVTIPESVKTIGQGAFASCTGLQEVYFYNTLEEIGYTAFNSCTSLQQIAIPGSVKTIDGSAFSDCTALASVTILPGCETIGYGAFANCTNLHQLTIPTTVTKIYHSAFNQCNNLSFIYYGGSKAQWEEISYVGTSNTWDSITVQYAINCDNGHHWDDGEITAHPSCTSPGEILYRCTLCEDAFYTDSIDPLSHGSETIVTKATLTTDGNITTQCPTCGGVESITFIPRIDAFSHPDHFFIWDGSVKTPTPIVWDREGNALTEGVDYTLSYPGNASNVGTYNMVITFKGNYSGTKTLTYEIGLETPSVTISATTTGVKIDWNTIPGATYYNVYRSVYSGGTWSAWTTIKSGVTGTTYTDTTVASNADVKYTVRAVKGSYTSDCESSSSIKFLATPTVTVANATNGVKINWNSISGAASYKVYKSVYTNGTWSAWTAIKSGVTGTSYTDTSVKSNDNAKYMVRAVNGSYASPYESSSAIKFLATPKVTVANTTTGVKVSWNKIAGAKTYIVYKSTNTNGTWSAWKSIKTGITGTSYTDTSLKSNANVKYTVRAVNSSHMSSYTGSSAIKFLATPKVTVANTTTGVKVSWGAISGAKTYTVYKSTNTNGTWSAWKSIKTGVTGTSFTDTSLKSNANVKYTVRAVNGSYVSSYTGSSAIKFLAAPTVKAANAAKGVTVTWNKITGAKTYTVYRSVYSGGKWSAWSAIKTGVTGTSYTDTTVKSGATVKYMVRAVNGSYISSYAGSNTTKFLTQPTVKVAKVTNGIKATWGKITGASGYIVYRRTYSNGKWSGWTAVKTTTALSFTDTTAKKGVTYQYAVRAYSGDYKSSYTNSSSIKR